MCSGGSERRDRCAVFRAWGTWRRSILFAPRALSMSLVAVKERGKKKENICSCAPRLFHAAEIYKAERNNAELNRSLQETSGIVLEGDIRRPTSTTRSRNIFFVRAFSQSTGYLFIFRYRSPSIDYMEIFIVTQILRARQYEKVLLYEGFMNMMRLTQMY